jgi:tetratricopeptide (TPR) repeat protein
MLWPASPAPVFPHGRVALADVANDTGEPELEVSGLLRTVLEQSTVIDVLPRTRLIDSLREGRDEEVTRIDEMIGTEAARRCGARALLLARLLRFGTRYVSFKEQEDALERLPELIDRVGEQVRLLLGEDPRAIRERTIPARSITSNLAAWRHYTAGMACLERRSFASSFGACLAEMQAAVELDPGFAMAHLQISQLHFLSGDARALQKAALKRAQLHPERVPPHDQLKLRGWAAFVGGNDVEAKALFREAAVAAPDDKHAWYLAGEIPYHRDEFAESLPFFRRVHALDPLWLDASQHLSLALGATGDGVGLRAHAATLSALGAKPEAIAGLCYAQLWFEPGSAVATCERARAGGAGTIGDELLAIALLHVGARVSLDEHLAVMAGKPGPPGFAWCMSLWLLGQEGRWPELLRRTLEWQDPDSSWFHVTLAEMVLGAGDRELAWREALRVLELDRVLLSSLAVHFAYQGDLARAAELREYLPAGSPRVDVYDAVVRWRRGDPGGAVEPLRRVAAAAPLSTDPAIPPPLYLLGEALAEAGRDAEAIDALRRFQALPLSYPSWFVPRSQYFLARSLDRMGDRDGARRAIQPLLGLWSDASPGQPLLAEARSLGARLGVR